MLTLNLALEPLSKKAFEPFGNVIETSGAEHFSINAGTIERFHDLADVAIGEGENARVLINIASCNMPADLPYRLPFMERHPLGSQAFIPMDETPLIVAVAPKGDYIDPAKVKAYISNGRQGVNYHPGVWHMPLICLEKGQQMLLIDRGGAGKNCEEYHFPDHQIVLCRR